jgi:hypothetical protein
LTKSLDPQTPRKCKIPIIRIPGNADLAPRSNYNKRVTHTHTHTASQRSRLFRLVDVFNVTFADYTRQDVNIFGDYTMHDPVSADAQKKLT